MIRTRGCSRYAGIPRSQAIAVGLKWKLGGCGMSFPTIALFVVGLLPLVSLDVAFLLLGLEEQNLNPKLLFV